MIETGDIHAEITRGKVSYLSPTKQPYDSTKSVPSSKRKKKR